ncbi:hypothetical protein MD484_g6179, partial [Candolleomyces efflorescens]
MPGFNIDKVAWKKADDVYMRPGEGRADDLVIPVMGSTGVGKSTFINNVLEALGSTQRAEVTDDYNPCTSKVAHYVVDCTDHQDLPQLRSRRLVLVDTLGFDHLGFSNEETLRRITVWLASSYSNQIKVAGVVYLHSIAGGRFTDSHASGFEIFKSICGEDSLPTIVLATTRTEICSPAQRSEREGHLRAEVWKGMLDHPPKATMTRLENSSSSALEVVKIILTSMNGVTPLLIQRQIVDDKKSYNKTDAARTARPQNGSGLSKVVNMFRQFIQGL